jgi:hypothetical protein
MPAERNIVGLWIDGPTMEAVEKVAASTGCSRSHVARRALLVHLDGHPSLNNTEVMVA